jgi:hypothetical protein
MNVCDLAIHCINEDGCLESRCLLVDSAGPGLVRENVTVSPRPYELEPPA